MNSTGEKIKVTQRAARAIRDSGRFLLGEVLAGKDSGKLLMADVKAALQQAKCPSGILERWREGKRAIKVRKVDLGQALEEVTLRLADLILELEVEVESEWSAETPRLELDALRIGAAIEVLLSTGLHYLGKGARISLRLEPEQALLGVGGSEVGGAGLERLEALLSQADSQLGLAASIAEAHGGRLWVEVSAGELRLSLPRGGSPSSA